MCINIILGLPLHLCLPCLNLEAMVEMQDEYIGLPRNITELRRITKCYEAAGLPGCYGSMDVVHVMWSSFPTGITIARRVRRDISLLPFNVLLTLTMVHNSALGMTRRLLRLIAMYISL